MAMIKLLTALVLIVSMGVTGSVCAQDFGKGKKAYEEKDYATALKEWRYLAERETASAQWQLGDMYASGSGVVQDNIYTHT